MCSYDKTFYFSSGKFRCTELTTWGGVMDVVRQKSRVAYFLNVVIQLLLV